MSPDDDATAAEALMITPPPDDAGASTADRYDWQAAMAAADGLALYMDTLEASGQLPPNHNCRIVCEHHEDWALVKGDDVELVSAKHREPPYGIFTTVNQLVTSGGLAHLFIRWHALGERPICRLVTTAGLGPGEPQGLDDAAIHLRKLRLAGQDLSVDGDHERAIVGFTHALLRNPAELPDIWTSGLPDSKSAPITQQLRQAARFLSMLSIRHGEPRRGHIRYAAPAMYCKPVLDHLGYTATPAEAVWEAVLGLFRVRMRAAGPIPTGALPRVLEDGTSSPSRGVAEAERDLAARIITLGDIDIAIHEAVEYPDGFLPLNRLVRVNRMAVKMAMGRCTDNSIERAEYLRLSYQKYWRARMNGDPTARVDQERLRRALLRVSDQATATVATSVGAWGPDLWTEIQRRADSVPEDEWFHYMESDLILGCACDLANRCRIWFSHRFDINAKIAELRAQQGT